MHLLLKWVESVMSGYFMFLGNAYSCVTTVMESKVSSSMTDKWVHELWGPGGRQEDLYPAWPRDRDKTELKLNPLCQLLLQLAFLILWWFLADGHGVLFSECSSSSSHPTFSPSAAIGNSRNMRGARWRRQTVRRFNISSVVSLSLLLAGQA
jgi:hypothetical protein